MTQEKEKEAEVYRTTNFYTAVWFKMNGLNLVGINRENPNRLVFMFPEGEKRRQLFEEFWKQEIVQRFISYIQEMKVEMYADNPPMIFRNKIKYEEKTQ